MLCYMINITYVFLQKICYEVIFAKSIFFHKYTRLISLSDLAKAHKQ